MVEQEPPNQPEGVRVEQTKLPATAVTVTVPQSTGVKVSHEDFREKVAGIIALGIFGLFALTVLLPLIDHLSDHWFQSSPHQCEMTTFVETMAAHEVILLAIIIAFYFSERRLETKN